MKFVYLLTSLCTLGVACFNGPYHWGANSRYLGPADIDFKWDIYHTDYDCFELYPGAFVHNDGDGGYVNVSYAQTLMEDQTLQLTLQRLPTTVCARQSTVDINARKLLEDRRM